MGLLAVNWDAIGSVATGLAAVAAFLGIVPSLYVYRRQDRRDRETTIVQRIQVIAAETDRVQPLIQLAFPTVMDSQVRQLRQNLGDSVTSAEFLDALFNSSALFLTSGMEGNLSSAVYTRMNDLWDQINQTSAEFRGALRIFYYACYGLTLEPYAICTPTFTKNILDSMKKTGAVEPYHAVANLDTLTNQLLTTVITVGTQIYLARSDGQIEQAARFVSELSEITLNLPEGVLLKLSRKRVATPSPTQDVRTKVELALRDLSPEIPEQSLAQLRDRLAKWREVSTPEYSEHVLGGFTPAEPGSADPPETEPPALI